MQTDVLSSFALNITLWASSLTKIDVYFCIGPSFHIVLYGLNILMVCQLLMKIWGAHIFSLFLKTLKKNL